MDDTDSGKDEALPVYGRLREPSHRVRHDGWTGEKQRAFLEGLATVGNVRDACRAVGLSSQAAYRLRRIDPAFGEAWDQALKQASTSLEAVAFARAVEGAEEVVIRRGEEVSRKRKPSDSLLRMLLQASNPDKYGRTGPNASVKAREEVEARVKEIERAAFNRAWRCILAEYRYQCEPHAMSIWVLRRLKAMHLKLCENPWCRECHPERAGEEPFHDLGDLPPANHAPLPPPGDWLEVDEEEEAAIDALLAESALDPPDAWIRADGEEMDALILKARLAGEEPALPHTPPPFPGYDAMQAGFPPVWRDPPPDEG